MHERIKSVLEHDCLATSRSTILTGVSGGPDSLCLAAILHELHYPVVIAHLDHQLRDESGTEAENVRRFANSLGIPFVLEEVDVYSLQKEYRTSIEEAARIARYHFLFRVAGEIQAQAVAVGHTADDQVETFLMHLLRGAGLSGLKGMSYRSLPNSWSAEIPLIRPLLAIWRKEIMDFIQIRGFTPNQDASNQDNRFLRNRIRNEMIPYLEEFNPRVKQSVWRAADMLNQDYSVFDRLIQQAWDECSIQTNEHFLAFDIPTLRSRPKAIQRHLIQRALHLLQPASREIDFDAVDKIIMFLSSPSRSRRIDVVANLNALQEGGRLWLLEDEADLPVNLWPQMEDIDCTLRLDVPGEVFLAEGWRLKADHFSLAGMTTQIQTNHDMFQAWLDAESVSDALYVRARHPGDRFRPLGMDGHSQKVSDLMTNRDIERRARSRWPLVCAGSKIVWIPGMGIAHDVRVTEKTQIGISLCVWRV